jgi:hypothetical protein
VLIQNWVDGESARVGRIDLTTGEMKDVLAYPGKSVWHPYYSRDDKWMTFKLELDSSHHQLFITPVKEYVPEGRWRWIPLTTGKYWDDKPQLSPDGNTLYFTSNRDGFNCIWAERLNPLTKYPVGQPFAVQHFHTIRYLTSQEHPLIWMDIQVATDKLIALINDARADIWMMRYGSPE